MRSIRCEACAVEHPMRETFAVCGKNLCEPCANQFIGEQGGVNADRVERHNDPTVCGNCGADNGDTPHAELMKVPTCPSCIAFFRNRPYPTWIKGVAAAVGILVVVSFAWNWRFFQGYFEEKKAFVALKTGDYSQANVLMSAAAGHIPESPFLVEMAALAQGLAYMEEDKCLEAQKCFARCSHVLQPMQLSILVQNAALGAAFERKDFDAFLKLSEEMAQRQPNDAVARAQVASALACQYAVHGDVQKRVQAEAKLAEAKKLGDEALKASDYEARIRHRLETREIITRREFVRRFPHGWKPST